MGRQNQAALTVYNPAGIPRENLSPGASDAFIGQDSEGPYQTPFSALGAVQSVSKTLTSAQVLALHTTPQAIIPAPGAGKLIVVDYAAYTGTGAYTQADGAGLVYHGTSTGADQAYTGPHDPFINGTYVSPGYVAGASLGAGIGLGVDLAAITTNPTVGTTPVTVTVSYRVLNVG
jgi:hypothetical protein